MSFQDQVKKAIDNAPAAGFVNVNYGKLEAKVNVASWHTKEDGGREIMRVPFEEDYELKKGEYLEISFKILISEVNPALEFDYERNVQIRTTSEDGKFKTDWSETVLPSLEKLFGKDKWIDVVLNSKKPVYVAAEHCSSVVPPKEGKKDYGVPKFIQVFKSLDECKAAREERYGKPEEATEFGEDLGVPKEVVDQAAALLKSVKGDVKKLRTMLDGHPFGEYDTDAVVEELKAKGVIK